MSQFSSENADICRFNEIFAIHLPALQKVFGLIAKASVMSKTHSLMFNVLACKVAVLAIEMAVLANVLAAF